MLFKIGCARGRVGGSLQGHFHEKRIKKQNKTKKTFASSNVREESGRNVVVLFLAVQLIITRSLLLS